MTKTLALIGLSLWLGACVDSGANGQEGAACVRLAQCAPGFACVDGMCSTDLSPLAEAGLVPVLDAGGMLDSGALPDAGTLPDSGSTDFDAGN